MRKTPPAPPFSPVKEWMSGHTWLMKDFRIWCRYCGCLAESPAAAILCPKPTDTEGPQP